MKTIAILYIATGPYIAFWNDFYNTFEKYFLNNTEKHYFVFTDAKNIYQASNTRVHTIFQESSPWPLPTLLKFHQFLTIREELLKYDYCYQSNANIICKDYVLEEEFLPRKEKGEDLFFVQHPGYLFNKAVDFPYERSSKSLAYVPYNKGKIFVFGAMNGGFSSSYIDFIEKLDANIVEDLKHNVIALWHDESHVNKALIEINNFRLLPSAYCYPVGFDVPGKCIITGVPKNTVFDVNSFKGVYSQKKISLIQKIYIRFLKNRFIKIHNRFCWIRDSLFRR